MSAPRKTDCEIKTPRRALVFMSNLPGITGLLVLVFPVTPATIRMALVNGSDRRHDYAVYLKGLSDHGVSVACKNGSHEFDDRGRYRS
jgi:hypothetical protein